MASHPWIFTIPVKFATEGLQFTVACNVQVKGKSVNEKLMDLLNNMEDYYIFLS